MGWRGRLVVVSTVLFFHSAYICYYYARDGHVDPMDLLGYPLFFILAYWSGKQYDRATYFAEKDTLTHLYNRRFVQQSFDKIAALADRTGNQLFVMAMDCNRFKQINDTYDHQAGDAALQVISQALLACTRQSDIVSRWGGDEFLIIGHLKDRRNLQNLENRIHEELNAKSKEHHLPLQVSVGSSVYPDEARTLSELMKLADQRMYANKVTQREE